MNGQSLTKTNPLHHHGRGSTPGGRPRHEAHSFLLSGKRRQDIKPNTISSPQNKSLADSQLPQLQQGRSRKRRLNRLPDQTSKRRKTTNTVSADNAGSISHWIRERRWPKKFSEPEDNMSFPLARKKSSSSSLQRKASESSAGTPSDYQPREEKSAPYTNPRYKTLLETKGSFMDICDVEITGHHKALCQKLLDSKQDFPADSLFRDDLFRKTSRNLEDRNESRAIQDIARLIVPSAETLATFGVNHLEILTENVNEGWNESIPLVGPCPQPSDSSRQHLQRSNARNCSLASAASQTHPSLWPHGGCTSHS